jgi:3-dehydroquinate dehydratase-2
MNSAAFTHTSVAILDALKTLDGPIMEMHISNVHQREAFRHSYVLLATTDVIAGFSTQG